MMEAKDLTIKSVIYFLPNNSFNNLFKRDYSTDKEVVNNIIQKITVNDITLNKEKEEYLINETSSYQGSRCWRIVFTKNELKKSIIERKDGVYFINEDDYYKIIRDGVVKYLNEIKESVKVFEEKQEQKYKDVQRQYWDFLNKK